MRLLEFTKKNNVCQEKNKKKRLTRFYFLCNIPPKNFFEVVSSSFLIGKGLGGQCKFSDFFELENLCYIRPELPEVVSCGFFME